MSQPRRSRTTDRPSPVRVIARDLSEPVRLDRFLRDQYPEAGRRSIQSLISGGRVSVNKRQVRLASWLIRNGDRVELLSAPRAKPRPFAAFDDRWIIADRGDIIAIDKPAGLLAELRPARPLAPGQDEVRDPRPRRRGDDQRRRGLPPARILASSQVPSTFRSC